MRKINKHNARKIDIINFINPYEIQKKNSMRTETGRLEMLHTIPGLVFHLQQIANSNTLLILRFHRSKQHIHSYKASKFIFI